VTEVLPRSCRDPRQPIREPSLIGPPRVLNSAMRAARIGDDVWHLLKTLRVCLDPGLNVLSGLRASNHENGHLLSLSHPVHSERVKFYPPKWWSKLLTFQNQLLP
jgi:hypothetical protein